MSVGEELDSQIEDKKRQSAGDNQSTWNSKRVCEIGEFYLPGTVFYYHPYIGNEKEYKRYEMQKSCFGVSGIDCSLQLGDDVGTVLPSTHSSRSRSRSVEATSV